MACSGYHTEVMCSATDSSTTAQGSFCSRQAFKPFPDVHEWLKLYFTRDFFSIFFRTIIGKKKKKKLKKKGFFKKYFSM